MKISQLIEELAKLEKRHGDIEVVCLHNLGEHATKPVDIIKGMSYLTTVEHAMFRSTHPNFEEPHILVTL